MIDHTGVSVSDFEKSKKFYTEALRPIGYELLLEFPSSVTGKTNVAGFGEPPKTDFWIGEGTERSSHSRCVSGRQAFAGRRISSGCSRGGRKRLRRARPPAPLSFELLRRLRPRPGRSQHRSRLPRSTSVIPSFILPASVVGGGMR